MIRGATPADVRAIAQVQTRAWWRAYQDVIPPEKLAEQNVDDREVKWREWMAREDVDVLVFEVEGEVIGFAGVLPTRDDDLDREVFGELATLYVDPPAQGAGVGSQLLDRALEVLAGRGFREASLWVFRDNGHGRSFYECRGWKLDAGAHANDEWMAPAVRYTRAI